MQVFIAVTGGLVTALVVVGIIFMTPRNIETIESPVNTKATTESDPATTL